MRRVTVLDCDHLFEAGNFRCTQVNQFSPNLSNIDNNFLKCLRKSRKLLKGLENSVTKTRQYEDDIMRRRRGRVIHLHDKVSREIINVYPANLITAKTTSPRSQNSFSTSSSAISLVGLQHQYEELCDRYDALLCAFDKHCQSSDNHCKRAQHLCKRIRETHTELAQLHRSLMGIAEKYLTLKYKKMLQKTRYRDRISKLKRTLPELLSMVETKHPQITERLSQLAGLKHDAAVTLLVAEMSKSNDLLLENIRLKTKLEVLTMD